MTAAYAANLVVMFIEGSKESVEHPRIIFKRSFETYVRHTSLSSKVRSAKQFSAHLCKDPLNSRQAVSLGSTMHKKSGVCLVGFTIQTAY
jgi:hypothetical protein